MHILRQGLHGFAILLTTFPPHSISVVVTRSCTPCFSPIDTSTFVIRYIVVDEWKDTATSIRSLDASSYKKEPPSLSCTISISFNS